MSRMILIQAVLLLLFLMNKRKLKSLRPSSIVVQGSIPYHSNLKISIFNNIMLYSTVYYFLNRNLN